MHLRVYLYRKKYSTSGHRGGIVLMKHRSATNGYMSVPKVKDNEKTPWLNIYSSPRTSTEIFNVGRAFSLKILNLRFMHLLGSPRSFLFLLEQMSIHFYKFHIKCKVRNVVRFVDFISNVINMEKLYKYKYVW